MPKKALKILLLGASGQLGSALQRRLSLLGELIAPTRAVCDLARPATVRDCVRGLRPDLIVNAAAWTDVERAQREPMQAMAVNGDGPALLAQEANTLGALLVHYSSDYVFDGRLGRPYVETDTPNPLSVYGRSKLAGDEATAQARNHLILRTGWLYGVHGNNFLKTMLRQMMQRANLGVVSDQIGTPTRAALLADVTAHLLARYARLHATGDDAQQALPCGLYHVAASGHTCWYGYACEVAKQARAFGLPLKLSEDSVQAIRSSDWPTQAERPTDSRLDTQRLRHAFGLYLPPWQDDVRQVVAQLSEGFRLCAS